MTAVIEVTGLTKRYGGQAVVDGISFHVDKGEIFGILGPNGAGKTTAVECLEGLRRRDAGEVRVLGLDPRTDGHRLHQRIGVQLQETQLQDKLKVREALELYASFYPNPADWRELLEPLGAGRQERHQLRQAVRRPEAAAVHRAGPGREPGGGVPRRADRRPGPGRPARHLGPDQAGAGAAASPSCWSATSWTRWRSCATASRSSNGGGSRRWTPRRGWWTRPGASTGCGSGRWRPLDEQSLAALPGVVSVTRRGAQVDVTGTGDFASAVTAELARRQVVVADLRIEGRSLDSAYVALTGRTMDTEGEQK